MKKLISLLLVAIFSIALYRLSSPSYDGVIHLDFLWFFSLGGLIMGIILGLIDSNAETIVKGFAIEVLKKNGLYRDSPYQEEIIKIKGSLSNHQKFSSFESDSLLKTVKIFGYRPDRDSLRNLSNFTGSKRQTVLHKDYHAPRQDWLTGFGDSEGCEIFFVIWEIEQRKLLSFNLNEKQAYYESLDKTMYPKKIIEIYSR